MGSSGLLDNISVTDTDTDPVTDTVSDRHRHWIPFTKGIIRVCIRYRSGKSSGTSVMERIYSRLYAKKS